MSSASENSDCFVRQFVCVCVFVEREEVCASVVVCLGALGE